MLACGCCCHHLFPSSFDADHLAHAHAHKVALPSLPSLLLLSSARRFEPRFVRRHRPFAFGTLAVAAFGIPFKPSSSVTTMARKQALKRSRSVSSDSLSDVSSVSLTSPRKKRGAVKREVKTEAEEAMVASPSKQGLSDRKLATYKNSIAAEPFPTQMAPTAEECERVAWLLGEWHGYRREGEGGAGLPKYEPARGEDRWGGCGDV